MLSCESDYNFRHISGVLFAYALRWRPFIHRGIWRLRHRDVCCQIKNEKSPGGRIMSAGGYYCTYLRSLEQGTTRTENRLRNLFTDSVFRLSRLADIFIIFSLCGWGNYSQCAKKGWLNFAICGCQGSATLSFAGDFSTVCLSKSFCLICMGRNSISSILNIRASSVFLSPFVSGNLALKFWKRYFGYTFSYLQSIRPLHCFFLRSPLYIFQNQLFWKPMHKMVVP